MSMSYPFLFRPVELYQGGQPHYVVDGGLLSNFPIWLFDSPNPKRPTWGFRLHPGAVGDRGAAAPGDSAPALVGAASEGDVLGGDRGLGPREHGAHRLRAHGEHPDARDQHHRLQPHAGERAVALQVGQGRSLGVLQRPGAEELSELVRAGRRRAAAAPAESRAVPLGAS